MSQRLPQSRGVHSLDLGGRGECRTRDAETPEGHPTEEASKSLEDSKEDNVNPRWAPWASDTAGLCLKALIRRMGET